MDEPLGASGAVAGCPCTLNDEWREGSEAVVCLSFFCPHLSADIVTG